MKPNFGGQGLLWRPSEAKHKSLFLETRNAGGGESEDRDPERNSVCNFSCIGTE